MIACLKGERKKSLKRERNCKGMRIPLLFKELYLQPEKDEPVQIISGTRTCTCRKRQRSRKCTCSAEKDENQPEFCLEKRAGVRSRPGDRRWKGGDEHYVREGLYFIFNHV